MIYEDAIKVFMIMRKEYIWKSIVDYHGNDLNLEQINGLMKKAMNNVDVQRRVESIFVAYILNQNN